MAGGAETSNIAALPAIARLGACESARGPDADRRVKLLIQFAVEGSLSGAYSQPLLQCSGTSVVANIRTTFRERPMGLISWAWTSLAPPGAIETPRLT
jgi:hypothetical protein